MWRAYEARFGREADEREVVGRWRANEEAEAEARQRHDVESGGRDLI